MASFRPGAPLPMTSAAFWAPPAPPVAAPPAAPAAMRSEDTPRAGPVAVNAVSVATAAPTPAATISPVGPAPAYGGQFGAVRAVGPAERLPAAFSVAAAEATVPADAIPSNDSIHEDVSLKTASSAEDDSRLHGVWWLAAPTAAAASSSAAASPARADMAMAIVSPKGAAMMPDDAFAPTTLPSTPPAPPASASLTDAEIPAGDVIIDTTGELGSGSFGRVWRAKFTGATVAVKSLKKGLRAQGVDAKFMREIELLKKCSHPRVLRCFGFMRGLKGPLAGDVCLVSELATGGTLEDRITRAVEAIQGTAAARRVGPCMHTEHPLLGWDDTLQIALHVCGGLVYLHDRGLVHCDLKPANILFMSRSPDSALIADFGLARACGGAADITHDTSTGTIGTWQYLALENVSKTSEYYGRPPGDIFSFALTFIHTCSGGVPWGNAHQGQIWTSLSRGDSPVFPRCAEANAPLKSLLEQCLARDPAARPDARTLEAKLQQLHDTIVGPAGMAASAATASPELPHASAPTPASLPPIAELAAAPSPQADGAAVYIAPQVAVQPAASSTMPAALSPLSSFVTQSSTAAPTGTPVPHMPPTTPSDAIVWYPETVTAATAASALPFVVRTHQHTRGVDPHPDAHEIDARGRCACVSVMQHELASSAPSTPRPACLQIIAEIVKAEAQQRGGDYSSACTTIEVALGSMASLPTACACISGALALYGVTVSEMACSHASEHSPTGVPDTAACARAEARMVHAIQVLRLAVGHSMAGSERGSPRRLVLDGILAERQAVHQARKGICHAAAAQQQHHAVLLRGSSAPTSASAATLLGDASAAPLMRRAQSLSEDWRNSQFRASLTFSDSLLANTMHSHAHRASSPAHATPVTTTLDEFAQPGWTPHAPILRPNDVVRASDAAAALPSVLATHQAHTHGGEPHTQNAEWDINGVCACVCVVEHEFARISGAAPACLRSMVAIKHAKNMQLAGEHTRACSIIGDALGAAGGASSCACVWSSVCDYALNVSAVSCAHMHNAAGCAHAQDMMAHTESLLLQALHSTVELCGEIHPRSRAIVHIARTVADAHAVCIRACEEAHLATANAARAAAQQVGDLQPARAASASSSLSPRISSTFSSSGSGFVSPPAPASDRPLVPVTPLQRVDDVVRAITALTSHCDSGVRFEELIPAFNDIARRAYENTRLRSTLELGAALTFIEAVIHRHDAAGHPHAHKQACMMLSRVWKCAIAGQSVTAASVHRAVQVWCDLTNKAGGMEWMQRSHAGMTALDALIAAMNRESAQRAGVATPRDEAILTAWWHARAGVVAVQHGDRESALREYVAATDLVHAAGESVTCDAAFEADMLQIRTALGF